MNNQERAAQIVNAIVQEIPVLTSNRQRLLHKEIMLQLDEVYREGCTDTIHNSPMFAEGFAAAKEKAAGVAANLMFELGEPSYAGAYGSKIAKRIRKMTNE